MWFKYPNLLWALLALLIPLLVHLFQLRRFQKTPFTNVALLKKVVIQSRKSSRIKKWIVLSLRLLLLTALILAFAQPYFNIKGDFTKQREVVIYLDNSYSMQAPKNNTPILQSTVQELLLSFPEAVPFTLFTNDNSFKSSAISQIRNELLELPVSGSQLSLDEILLRASGFFKKDPATLKELLIVTDFQNREQPQNDSIGDFEVHYINCKSNSLQNILIDSLSVKNYSPENKTLSVHLRASYPSATSVSLLNNNKLLTRLMADFNDELEQTLEFTIPADKIFNGQVSIEDQGLVYDNFFYFNLNKPQKIKVLSINDANSGFLQKLFVGSDYAYTSFEASQIDYSKINDQNLIILNQLPQIPLSLITTLRQFITQGGYIAFIPAVSETMNPADYSDFLNTFGLNMGSFDAETKKVTRIVYGHPLFDGVFTGRVSNFQFPQSEGRYTVTGGGNVALDFEDNSPFLVQKGHLWLFTAPLGDDFSNFKESQLIVPVFHNMALKSLRLPQLYYYTADKNELEINTSLSRDEIITIQKPGYQFIPLQQSWSNKVKIRFSEQPSEAGIYKLAHKDSILQNISINDKRDESRMDFLNPESLSSFKNHETLSSYFEDFESKTANDSLWKWFAILALLFLVAELLVLKFVK